MLFPFFLYEKMSIILNSMGLLWETGMIVAAIILVIQVSNTLFWIWVQQSKGSFYFYYLLFLEDLLGFLWFSLIILNLSMIIKSMSLIILEGQLLCMQEEKELVCLVSMRPLPSLLKTLLPGNGHMTQGEIWGMMGKSMFCTKLRMESCMSIHNRFFPILIFLLGGFQ